MMLFLIVNFDSSHQVEWGDPLNYGQQANYQRALRNVLLNSNGDVFNMKTSVTITKANESLLNIASASYTNYEEARNTAVAFIQPVLLIAHSLNVPTRKKKATTEHPVTPEMFRTTYIVDGLGCDSLDYAKEICAIVVSTKVRELIGKNETNSTLTKKLLAVNPPLCSLRDFNSYKKKAAPPNRKVTKETVAAMTTGDLTAHMIKQADKFDTTDELEAEIRTVSNYLDCLKSRLAGINKQKGNPVSNQQNVNRSNGTQKATAQHAVAA